jgi:hypothetical protein
VVAAAAAAAARERPQLNLLDALEPTMLIARKDSGRFPAGRGPPEQPEATIEICLNLGSS